MDEIRGAHGLPSANPKTGKSESTALEPDQKPEPFDQHRENLKTNTSSRISEWKNQVEAATVDYLIGTALENPAILHSQNAEEINVAVDAILADMQDEQKGVRVHISDSESFNFGTLLLPDAEPKLFKSIIDGVVGHIKANIRSAVTEFAAAQVPPSEKLNTPQRNTFDSLRRVFAAAEENNSEVAELESLMQEVDALLDQEDLLPNQEPDGEPKLEAQKKALASLVSAQFFSKAAALQQKINLSLAKAQPQNWLEKNSALIQYKRKLVQSASQNLGEKSAELARVQKAATQLLTTLLQT